MADESGLKIIEDLKDKPEPGTESDQLSATQPAQPKPWNRIDRIRLLLWAGLAFLVPMVLVFGFHLSGGARTSVLDRAK